MNAINALGFVEVYGLAAGIEAADAMLKSAKVRLLREHEVHPGLVTLTVEGDLAACRAAVSAGVAAASRVGKVIASNVIGRPDEDTEMMVLSLIPRPSPDAGQKEPPVKATAKTRAAAKMRAPAMPVQTDEAPSATAPVAATPDAVFAFISKASRGRAWGEIAKRFPDRAQQGLREELDAHVAAGRLTKAGARYRKP